VSKINASGSAFVYSTFLGGSGAEDTGAIALDSGRNVYVVGSTTSSDFPTKNPIQATNGGGWDVFVAKIDAGGNALLYSTYLGGSGNDRAYTPEIGGGTGAGIGVDPVGNVYVTGSTESSDFPVYNAIQSTFGGDSDALIAGINAGGDALIYSTYFGGHGAESGAGLTVDSRGSVYVAGTTDSSLPITPAAADRSNGGAFLIKIAPNTFVSGLPAKAFFTTQLVGTTGAPKNFALKNNGTTPLTINRIYVMGANASDFTQTNTCGNAIAAGAKCTIAVSFSPSALNLRQAALVISDSDPASPQAVALGGYGTVVLFSPTKLSFGNQSVGTSVSQSVTLTNTGKAALKIISISVTGSDAEDFSQTNNCGTGIPASGQCTITVTFRPTATGRRTAAVAVKDNGGGSPQGVPLTGTGI
jgi:Abnormal spindle-like microcephaly-assoc'd, ASPM-SPD-2-Hydin/Beta-propeller repeat